MSVRSPLRVGRSAASASAQGSTTVEVRGLTKAYGDATIVDHLSFDAHPGEVLGLLGRNGAGKTTTLDMLCGLLTPSSGTALIGGRDVARDRAARRAVGYVPQENTVFLPLSVRHNVQYAAQLRRVRKQEIARRTDELLERLSLASLADRTAAKLSGGERRRLSLAMGLIDNPGVIVLDEPTAAVDVDTRREILALVRDLRAEGTTIIYSTHYLEEAESLCDRVTIIRDGRLVLRGTVDEIVRGSGARTLTVRADTSSPIAAVLRSLGFQPVQASPGVLILEVADENELSRASAASLTAGAHFDELRIVRGSLERAFLSATSRAPAAPDPAETA